MGVACAIVVEEVRRVVLSWVICNGYSVRDLVSDRQEEGRSWQKLDRFGQKLGRFWVSFGRCWGVFEG